MLAAVPFRWRQFVSAARALPQLFAPYAAAAAAAGPEETPEGAEAAVVGVVDAAEVQATVQSAIAAILGTQVDPSQPLMEAGLDSLGAMELQNSLQLKTGLQLPSTLVFDYPTVAALAAFLADKMGGQVARRSSGAAIARFSSAAEHELAGGYGGGSSGAVAVLGSSWRSTRESFGRLGAAEGLDAVGLVPLDRWDVEAEPLAARFGAYLLSMAAFDAAAFSISDAEAVLMDPQQRLLLESVGEVLMGVPVDSAAAPMRARGVYVGACWLLTGSRAVPAVCSAAAELYLLCPC